MARQLRRITEPVDADEWEMPPHVVNAYYHPLRNEIVFPAGILQPPMFDAEADDALNFGGIGTVIAHEITHGFDDQGRRFDARGAFRDWWTEADEQRYTELTARLVEQFDGYAFSMTSTSTVDSPSARTSRISAGSCSRERPTRG